MRVLQLHNRHSSLGGADAVLAVDRDLLTGAGHEVEQLLLEPAGQSGRSRVGTALDATWNRSFLARLTTTIRRFRPDVLHVHTPFPTMSPAVFTRARSLGVATVGTVHSFRYSCLSGTLRRDGAICEDCVGHRLKWAGVRHRCYHDSAAGSGALALSLAVHGLRGTFSRDVQRFLPLTRFAADILVRDGVPAEHITVKPNCVTDPGPTPPVAERSPSALFLGRLVAEKGIATLLDAWTRHDPGLPLVIAGDGPLRDDVRRAAAASGGQITWLGHVSEAEAGRLQSQAQVTVVPSEWYEAGPPLVLLQALAAGTPVVCTDLANIAATAAEAGAATPFRMGDPADLAGAVAALATDPELLVRRGAAGRRLYERDHTPATALLTLERVYAEVVG